MSILEYQKIICSIHRPVCSFCSFASSPDRPVTVKSCKHTYTESMQLCKLTQHTTATTKVSQNNICNTSSCLVSLFRDNEVCVCIGWCCRNSRDPQMGCNKIQGTNSYPVLRPVQKVLCFT